MRRGIVSIAEVVAVHVGMVDRQGVGNVAALHRKAAAAPKRIVARESGVEVDMPWFSALLGDDIDDTSRGIAAVESTGCTFHYLYALHIAHVKT